MSEPLMPDLWRRALAADPDDDTVTLAYCDWLGEQESEAAAARAEWIRLSVERRTTPEFAYAGNRAGPAVRRRKRPNARFTEVTHRLRKLARSHWDVIAGPWWDDRGDVSTWSFEPNRPRDVRPRDRRVITFRSGFVHHATFTTPRQFDYAPGRLRPDINFGRRYRMPWLQEAAEVLARHPRVRVATVGLSGLLQLAGPTSPTITQAAARESIAAFVRAFAGPGRVIRVPTNVFQWGDFQFDLVAGGIAAGSLGIDDPPAVESTRALVARLRAVGYRGETRVKRDINGGS